MIKMKKHHGKVDLGLKLCKNCSKEYNDSENYNWSCKTHQYPYSLDEEMWWCCGKKGKESPGCKM